MLSESDIQKIQSLLKLSHFQIVLRPEWNSFVLDHRDLIRHYIYENFSTDRRVLDLSERPILSSGSISISHSNSFGGFAVTRDENASIGFDIEDNERIKERVVARISSTEEMESAPLLAALWAAKEAGYKSFPEGIQPSVMSDVTVENWKKIEDGFYECEAHLAQHGAIAKGVVVTRDGKTLAVCRY